MGKAFYKSRTFWVNLIAAAVLVYQGVTGHEFPLSPETQAVILAGINVVLRAITKEPITWG
jgi:hypothetical protein